MKVVPINFSQEHKEMLGKAKLLLEEKFLAIHPSFDKLITSMRTICSGGGLEQNTERQNEGAKNYAPPGQNK